MSDVEQNGTSRTLDVEEEEDREEKIKTLETQNQILRTQVDALRRGQDQLIRILLGEDSDPQEYTEENITDRLEKIRQDVETAKGFAKSSRGTWGKKKELAKELSRDRAVLAAVRGRTKPGGLPASRVNDLAGNGTELENRTVFDAWADLEKEYQAFEVNESRPKGLKAKRSELTRDLVLVVRDSLNDTGEVENLNNFLEGMGD